MKSVLITGASRGLGRALWEIHAGDGWRTFPLVRTREDARELVESAPGPCHPIVADIGCDRSIDAIRAVLAEHATSLDRLVNNAGTAGRPAALAAITTGEIAGMVEVHCLGVLRACKAAESWLRRSDRAFVVNVSSRLGSLERMAAGEFAGRSFSWSYRIAKAAQNMLSLCLAEELGEAGITVLAVHPGRVRTESGASDACLAPADAAERLYCWLLEQQSSARCRYVEPGVGEMPW